MAMRPSDGLVAFMHDHDMNKHGPRKITTMPRLLTKLDEVRKQGYAVDDEECRPGWRCVGAPIFDQMGRTSVAICLTGTVTELDDSKIASIAVVVKETAQRISRQLALENIQFAT